MVLESEVQVLGRLRHPNVVKLYDVIDANSILCLVLELVEVRNSKKTTKINFIVYHYRKGRRPVRCHCCCWQV